MNKIIKRFGKLVSDNIESNPERALSLLKAGYAASGFQIKFLPDKKLLPHQKYAAEINNKTVRKPLQKPEECAVVNIFMPCELLHAMDIAPQFAEGLAGYLNGAATERAFIDYAEKSGIPKTFCSYHKSMLGAALSGVIPKPRFILNTTMVCDANTLTFRTLADYWKIPGFIVDVPGVHSADALEYVTGQLEEASRFIEDAAGRKFNYDKLKQVIRIENRSLNMYRNYFEILSKKYLPNDMTSEMFKLTFTHILMGTREAEEYFRLLLDDVSRAQTSDNEIRILWVHTLPYWQDSIRNIINFSRKYQLLSCDLNYDFLQEMDENRPFESLARKLLNNIFYGSAAKRAEKLIDKAKSLNADGAVYFNHWGCKQTLGSAILIKEMMEGEGLPVLLLDGDGCDRDNINDGQMSTRLQAFLEILEAKR